MFAYKLDFSFDFMQTYAKTPMQTYAKFLHKSYALHTIVCKYMQISYAMHKLLHTDCDQGAFKAPYPQVKNHTHSGSYFLHVSTHHYA